MISNPILPGFNPDPSILRVGSDYYIATSTFEWFPGVKLYHSKDLKHWEQIGYALTRKSQLDLCGVETARGIWAPCLSYNSEDELFYLAYTVVYSIKGNHFDLDNFYVTASLINGPWSEPIYLNSSGFDPSLFHDEDGRSWLVNLEWESRNNYPHCGWIVLQEFDRKQGKLIGDVHSITDGGTRRGCIEAPHLYKRDDWYYLMTAEGGTGYGHAVVMQRSRDIQGPYTPDPQGAMLTSYDEDFDEFGTDDSVKLHRFVPDLALQKAGHGSLVHTAEGTPYIAHLCARPLLPLSRCILGRETAIQACEWDSDGWLRLSHGNRLAQEETKQPEELNDSTHAGGLPYSLGRDDFTRGCELGHDYQTYRFPLTANDCRYSEAGLTLRGSGSLFSTRRMTLLARRIHHFNACFETEINFEPEHYFTSAGLVLYYSSDNFYYLRIYYSESLKCRCLSISSSDLGNKREYTEFRVKLDESGKICLRAHLNRDKLQFSYCYPNSKWQQVGDALDSSILSDEYGSQKFTGCFVGLFCEDQRHQEQTATFSYLDYLV